MTELNERPYEIPEGVLNLLQAVGYGEDESRNITSGEYDDMQRRITNQRRENARLEERHKKLMEDLEAMHQRYEEIANSHEFLALEAEAWRTRYQRLEGAVNAVRSINMESM